MARKIADQSNVELIRVLELLLERDEDITARAVTRLHAGLANASAISRSPERQALLVQYRKRQYEFRDWHNKSRKKSRIQTSADLAQRDDQISQLKQQISALTRSHVAMIQAVGEVGGMVKLLEFYDHHRRIRDNLLKVGAIDETCSSSGS